jgi:hypothetical protein
MERPLALEPYGHRDLIKDLGTAFTLGFMLGTVCSTLAFMIGTFL